MEPNTVILIWVGILCVASVGSYIMLKIIEWAGRLYYTAI